MYRIDQSVNGSVFVNSLALSLFLLVLISVNVLHSHEFTGSSIRAFHFPDHMVPSIDGDLNDWQSIDPSYCYSEDLFTDLVADSEPDISDFRVNLCIGWNDTENKLYVSALVVDDIHQIDRPENTPPALIFQDDDLEIFVDADHSGGQFADFSDLSRDEQLAINGTEANHFILSGPPPPNGDFFVNFSAAGWYSTPDGPFTEAAIAANNGSVTYEFALTLFDRVDVGASFLSVEHDLRQGEIIGFNAEFNDFDSHSELYEAKWSLSGGHNAFRLSERFADLELDALAENFSKTVISVSSWAQIKASELH